MGGEVAWPRHTPRKGRKEVQGDTSTATCIARPLSRLSQTRSDKTAAQLSHLSSVGQWGGIQLFHTRQRHIRGTASVCASVWSDMASGAC